MAEALACLVPVWYNTALRRRPVDSLLRPTCSVRPSALDPRPDPVIALQGQGKVRLEIDGHDPRLAVTLRTAVKRRHRLAVVLLKAIGLRRLAEALELLRQPVLGLPRLKEVAAKAQTAARPATIRLPESQARQQAEHT